MEIKTKVRVILQRLLAASFLYFLFFLPQAFICPALADTHTSLASGNWSAGGTWDIGSAPVAGDNAVIASGHTVTLTTANASITDITINSGGTLNNGTRTLTVSGNYTVNGTHSGTGGTTLNGANKNIDGTGFITNTGTVTISGGAKSVVAAASLAFSGNIGISGAITVTNNAAITISGNLTGSAVGSTWVNAVDSTLTVAGTLLTTGTLTATANGNTVNYNSSGNRTVKPTTYCNLTFSRPVTYTIAAGQTATATGTLTLTDGTINTGTLAAQGHINLATTFDGGTTALQITGASDQTFTGGGSATVGDFLALTINKTGGTLTLASIIRTGRNWTYTAGTVNTGTSTVVFAIRALTITGSMSLYNVTFNSAVTYTVAANNTLTVTGTLTLTDGWINQATVPAAGTIACRGDILQASTFDGTTAANSRLVIDGATDQTFTGSATTAAGDLLNVTINKTAGTLYLAGTIRTGRNWTYTAGTVNTGTSTVVFAIRALTITGSMSLYNVTFNTATTYTIPAATTLTTTGTLSLTDGTINTGTLAAQGHINLATTFDGGTTALQITGASDQTFTGGGSATVGDFLALTINKTGGTLTLASIIRTGRNWTYTAGTVNTGTSTVVFDLRNLTITGSMSLYNVTFRRAATYTIAAGATLTTTGILTLTDGTINTGTLAAQGNIAVATTFDGGTAPLQITGAADQTLTGGGSATAGELLALTINKTGGTLTLASIIRTGRNWTYTAGTVDTGTSTVVFAIRALTITGSMSLYNVTFNTAWQAYTIAAGTTLTVTGALNLTAGYINTGNITAQGNVNVATTFNGSSATPASLTISGAADQTLTGGGSATAGDFLPLTINKTGGTLTLASIIRTGRNWTYTVGTVNTGTSTVVFDLRNLTITGSMSLYNVTFRRAATYTIPLTTTLTVTGTLNLTDGTINTGTIIAQGDINVAATADNGSAVITLNSINDQTITGTGSGHLTQTVNINKASGNAIITGNIRVHNLNLQAGNLTFQGGATYTIHNVDTITAAAGTTLNFSGTSAVSRVTLRSSAPGNRWRLTVNAAATYSADYVDARDSNASLGRTIVAYNSVNSGNNLNWLFPSQLVFTTSAQSVCQNIASSVITVQIQDGAGTPVVVPSNIRINLTSSSSSGLFSTSAVFGDNVTYVTIATGSSSANFYYKDSTAGIYTITAAESPSQGWTDATQTIRVESKGTWKYKREITITSSTSLNDFQVLLTLDTQLLISTGKMNSDGSDIRFYGPDDITGLFYWIESGINTTATRIWVRLPSSFASGSKIYLYYGNTSAISASSGSSTFDFFDDFDSFSNTVWAKTNVLSTVSGSRLLVYRGSVYTKSTVLSSSQDRMAEARLRWLTATGSYAGLMTANSQSTAGGNSTSKALVYYMMQSANGNRQVWYWAANGTAPSYNLGSALLFTAALNTDYIVGFVNTSGNQIRFYRDDVLLRTIAGSWNQAFYLWLGYYNGSLAANTDIKDISVDWVRVRKFASTNPVSSVGQEIKNVTQLAITSAAQSLVQDEASGLITIQAQAYDASAANVSVDTSIVLTTTSSNGSFSLDGSTWYDDTLTVTIPAGQSSLLYYGGYYYNGFYYKDTEIGTPAITVAESPDVGWTDATQVETIDIAIDTFVVSAVSPQVAGSGFTLTLTAKDEDGATATSFTGTANLTVQYISPASGSGALSVASTANFINGVAVITNQTFSDCGTITITATATLGNGDIKTGTSSNIIFIPYDFTVTADALQTVNKPFNLTVSARNAQGQVCPNYKGTANLSVIYVSPSLSQSGAITPSSLGSVNFTNGIAVVTTAKYNKWGRIKIRAAEALNAARYGESQEIMFCPKDFLITLAAPPKSRNFYYKNEEFSVDITARDEDNNALSNYQGAITLTSSDNAVTSAYTFVSADSGMHTFLLSFSSSGKKTLTVKDTTYTSVSSSSAEFEVKEAKIKVFSTSGPVGTVAVTVKILDSQDEVITEDDSTVFIVTLAEATDNNSAVCEAKTAFVAIQGGSAVIYVKDMEAEVVTVTPAANPVIITPVSGTVTFGSFRGRGIGIDMWREIK